MDYLTIANSPVMWICAGVIVGVVLLQAAIFAQKSIRSGKVMGITDEQIRTAVRSSIFSSIGPSLAILIGMISLLVVLGGPVAWMRLSVIGSVSYELMAAEFGAGAMGVSINNKEEMDGVVFANALWVMTIGPLLALVFTGLLTHKMDRFGAILSGGKKALMPIVSVAAMLGAFGYLSAARIVSLNMGSVAVFAGFAIMFTLGRFGEKKNIQWLKEWALGFATFGGMIIAAVAQRYIV